jgi:hypothetical protein
MPNNPDITFSKEHDEETGNTKKDTTLQNIITLQIRPFKVKPDNMGEES